MMVAEGDVDIINARVKIVCLLGDRCQHAALYKFCARRAMGAFFLHLENVTGYCDDASDGFGYRTHHSTSPKPVAF